MPVPYVFSSMSASQGIPLSDLDANFAALEAEIAVAGVENTSNTVATFETTGFAANVQAVSILGYYSIGVGALQVRRVASEPTHLWKFRSADFYLPNGSTSEANGGWWEGYVQNDWISIEALGGLAGGVFDCTPAWLTFVSYVASIPRPTDNYIVYTFVLDVGDYMFSDTIVMDFPCKIQGVGTKTVAGSQASFISFGYGYDGIHMSYAGCALSGVYLRCNGGYYDTNGWSAQDSYVGVLMNYRGSIEDCTISNWPSHGLYINTKIGGNANNWVVANTLFLGNGGCGMLVIGADANSGYCANCSAMFSGEFGFQDDSFLGNNFFSLHTEGQANMPFTLSRYDKTAYVIYGGYVYKIKQGDPNIVYPVPYLALAQTEPPGTGASWVSIASSSNEADYPTWGRVKYNDLIYDVQFGQEAVMWQTAPDDPVSGATVWGSGSSPAPGHLYVTWKLDLAPYCYGGPYAVRSQNGATLMSGCYQEGGQMYSFDYAGKGVWMSCQGVFFSPDAVATCCGGTDNGYSKGSFAVTGAVSTYRANADASTTLIATNLPDYKTYSLTDSVLGTYVVVGDRTSKDLNFNCSSSGNTPLAKVLSPTSTTRADRQGIAVNNLFVGSGANLADVSLIGARTTAAPSTGAYINGDLLFAYASAQNLDPLPLLYRCRGNGTPGTWETIWGSRAPILAATTVSGLPSASTMGAGARGFVTDANATTFLSTVAGGGSNKVPVVSDGTNWLIG